MLTLGSTTKVYLARGTTDLRKGFDGLAGAVREVLAQDPTSGHLFVFCGRRRHMIKVLYWDRTGFWVLAKRLARGTFAWPEAGYPFTGCVPEAHHRIPKLDAGQPDP